MSSAAQAAAFPDKQERTTDAANTTNSSAPERTIPLETILHFLGEGGFEAASSEDAVASAEKVLSQMERFVADILEGSQTIQRSASGADARGDLLLSSDVAKTLQNKGYHVLDDSVRN